MHFSKSTVALFITIGIASQTSTSLAFNPLQTRVCPHIWADSRTILKSTEGSQNDVPESRSESSALPPPTPPPPVPTKRLDPLMASLTRMDPETARGPTRNIPIFGEVPVDGSLVVLVPVALIGFLGFILSIVITVQSSDLIVDSLNRVVEDIAITANENTNKIYDENVCRGLCSSQEQDLDGLKSFMEGLRK